MKKVVIIGDTIIEGNTFGVQRFSLEILKELDKMEKIIDVYLVVPMYSDINVSFNTLKIIRYGKIKNRFIWRQLCLKRFPKNEYITVDMTLALPYFGCDIICLHDCIYENFDKNFKTFKMKIKRLSYLIRARHLIKKSKKVITVSNTSKKELIKYYGVKEEKIKIVHNAWQHFVQISEDETVLSEYNIKKKEFFFSLGSGLEHKNIKWILNLAVKYPNYNFVITGSDRFTNYYKEIGIEKINNIIYTGYIDDSKIKTLMKNCIAFLHPSLYEGFGIPPLEALSCGSEIVISNCSALPEIYENSAIYIDPYNYDINIEELIVQKKLKQDKENTLNKYSWKKSAEDFYKILIEVAICK